MTPQEQLRVLLAMVLCGATLGAAYDMLWLLRVVLFRGGAALAAMDLFFGVLCAAGIIGAALALEIDVLRFYTLAGALGGMALYRVSAGALLRAGVRRARKMAEKMIVKGRKMKNDAGKCGRRKNF